MRIETYLGKKALQDTWDEAAESLQIKEHEYLLELRRRVRQERMYVMHRAGADAHVQAG